MIPVSRLASSTGSPLRSVALCPLALTILCGGLALADPQPGANEVVEGLIEGSLEPGAGAEAWKKARLQPSRALKLLEARRVEAQRGPGSHEVELKDAHERASTAFLRVPQQTLPDGRYSVVIMLHGLGGNGRSTFDLAANLTPEHAIVIGPTALKPDKADAPEDLPPGDISKMISRQFPRWWSYRQRSFPLQALRYLRSNFPIDPDRVVLIGYSMGGYGTWNLGLRFAGAAPMAGGISRQEYMLGYDGRSRHLLGNARQLPLWILHGDKDEVVPVRLDRTSAKELEALDLPFVYEEVKGGKHVMRDQLEDGPVRRGLLEFISKRVRDPHPARVEHHAIDAYHGGAYWVRIDALRGERARVVAFARKQKIQVVCEGVAELTISLDPTLVDVKKPVRILINGHEVHRGKVGASLRSIADTLARTGDSQLTYAHSITISTPADLAAPSEGDWRLGLDASASK